MLHSIKCKTPSLPPPFGSKNAGSLNFYSQALEIISPRNLINLGEKTFKYWWLGFFSYTAQPDVLRVDQLGNKPHPLREFPINF